LERLPSMAAPFARVARSCNRGACRRRSPTKRGTKASCACRAHAPTTASRAHHR
jgi:hypothetical protein